MRIWQCPGHGGESRGCKHGNLIEKNWVLQIAKAIDPALRALGLEVTQARFKNVTIPYGDRARQAWDWGADLALCHHVNAMPAETPQSKKARGLLCFAANGMGIEVGAAIMKAAPSGLRNNTMPIRAKPDGWTSNAHYVLCQYEHCGIPAVLIEWGFATSPLDRKILMGVDGKYRVSLVAAAMAGVGRFLELTA